MRFHLLHIVIALILCVPELAQANPSIGTCVSALGTSSLTATLTNIASGQSLVVYHKGITTDPVVSDSLGDTFISPTVATATVNSVTNGCLNFDYVVTPKCLSFPCSDTVTIPNAGASTNNAATVCEVNNLGGVDALGGSPYTAGNPILSGPLTPLSSTDTAFAMFYQETTNSFVNPSQNYIGTGTPTDVTSATLSNGTLLVGAATETAVANTQLGLARTSQPPAIAVSGPMGASAPVVNAHPAVKLNIFAFPGA